jgi:O-glycosyl hydrolase
VLRALLALLATAAAIAGIAACASEQEGSPAPAARASAPPPVQRYRPVDLPVIGRATPSSCRPAPSALTSAPPNRVVVTGRKRQRISGWGASVVTDTYVDPLVNPAGLSRENLDALDRAVFEEGGVDMVRVFGPGYGRAPMNAPLERRSRDRTVSFMFRAASLGARFMFTGADAPARLKDGPRLRRGAEGRYARWIADYLQSSKRLGVTFSFTAIANEPDNGIALLRMSPDQSALVYAALAGELRRRDLGARLVLGDTKGWDSACPYLLSQAALLQPSSSPVAVASHAYVGYRDEARALDGAARRAGLEVWQTEWGTGCASCADTGGMPEAIRWSGQIVKALRDAGASAWFAFRAVADSTHGPGDALIVRTRSGASPFVLTKRYSVFRQYSRFGPRGSRVLVVGESIPQLDAVAFRTGKRTSVVLTNDAPRSRRVRVDLGDRRGPMTGRRTSPTEDYAEIGPIGYAGRPIRFLLPPMSVTTLSVLPDG